MLICEKKLNFSFALFQKILVLAQLVFIACKPYVWLVFSRRETQTMTKTYAATKVEALKNMLTHQMVCG